ncbi:MAG: 1-acyl-sn-glycerol-3-phosphate acyltransferase [Actinomycetota bacterium]
MQAETRGDVLVRVRALAETIAGVPVAPDVALADAGLDSLGYAELALAVEDAFGVGLGEADIEALRTPRDVADAVGRLSGGGRSARIPPGIGRRQALAERALGPILMRFYRVRISGREHIPRRGAAIVCANHNSLLDIPFLSMAAPRPIWFMAKVELFKGVGRPIFHALGGFPVRRGVNDLRAVDTGLAVLEAGRVLGMFPEGTRSPEELLPFLPGAAWLALARGASLVPAAISGAAESLPRGSKIPRRTNVTVGFAEAIAVEAEPDPRRRAERAPELTAELRRRVEGLIAQAPPAT